MEKDVALSELSLVSMQTHAPEIDASVFECLGSANAVKAFVSYGSTAPDQVKRQMAQWESRLG